jgi:hypothetical protein
MRQCLCLSALSARPVDADSQNADNNNKLKDQSAKLKIMEAVARLV